MATKQTLNKKIKEAISLLEKNGYTITPPPVPITIDTTEVNKQKMKLRREKFIEELAKFRGTYSDNLLNDFYAYWSESNKSFTKMRFELQSTFEIGRRLANIKVGQKAKVFADYGDGEKKEYEGTVSWISSRSEFTPKTILTDDERADLVYALKVAFKNDGYVKIGMYGEVKFN